MAKKTTKKKKSKVKRGRPKGKTNNEQAVAVGVLTRCPSCGSTERERYTKSTEQAYEGVTREGQRYTHIVRKWTICSSCLQHRIDRLYENRV